MEAAKRSIEVSMPTWLSYVISLAFNDHVR